MPRAPFPGASPRRHWLHASTHPRRYESTRNHPLQRGSAAQARNAPDGDAQRRHASGYRLLASRPRMGRTAPPPGPNSANPRRGAKEQHGRGQAMPGADPAARGSLAASQKRAASGARRPNQSLAPGVARTPWKWRRATKHPRARPHPGQRGPSGPGKGIGRNGLGLYRGSAAPEPHGECLLVRSLSNRKTVSGKKSNNNSNNNKRN